MMKAGPRKLPYPLNSKMNVFSPSINVPEIIMHLTLNV